jgi:hypothetical protein
MESATSEATPPVPVEVEPAEDEPITGAARLSAGPNTVEETANLERAVPTDPPENLDHATQAFHKLRDDFAEARAAGERYAIERGVRLLQVFARRYERSTDAAERKLAVQAYRLIEEAAPEDVGSDQRPRRRGEGPRPPRR